MKTGGRAVKRARDYWLLLAKSQLTRQGHDKCSLRSFWDAKCKSEVRFAFAILRIRVSDHKVDQVVDLKDFLPVGSYEPALTLAPDDSPLLLRDSATQDVYALDWEEP